MIEEESLKYWQFEDEKPEDAGIREKYLNSTSSGGGANDPNAISFVGHARCFENVINALRTGTEPEITGEEARKAVQIICSIYKSAQSGQKVVL